MLAARVVAALSGALTAGGLLVALVLPPAVLLATAARLWRLGLLAVPLPALHPELSRYGQRVDAAERAVALGGKTAAAAGAVLSAVLLAAGALG